MAAGESADHGRGAKMTISLSVVASDGLQKW
jgi:hypothetical protein